MVIRDRGKQQSSEQKRTLEKKKTQKITLPEMYVEQALIHLELERAWNTSLVR